MLFWTLCAEARVEQKMKYSKFKNIDEKLISIF